MQLGVCYYPEQWPRERWADDARRMRDMGIAWVRIGEFAWSRIEPAPDRLDWTWLDEAVETLHAQGLRIMMGTPTAAPPKWLVDAHPGILPVDAAGRPRGFGSRRHYCFSSADYRDQSVRITRLVAERYGHHPAIAAWQIDNEYGCHDTVLSYSTAARAGFRRWLADRYGTIDALNAAWGTTFWSQSYRSFDEIDAPVGAVTESHPAHRLDYRRYSSDQVCAYHRRLVDVVRASSPGRPIAHNFMGFFTEFDHRELARDLDIAAWDSYPLGFTQQLGCLDDTEKERWLRSGHPDIASFNHDLYRGLREDGRWWVMEQQPGPVNWASWNPAPADGMVRVWTWQAFGHGAEVVSYFRWRQVRHAQEQMHAGLHRPDGRIDQGGREAAQVADELRAHADTIAQAVRPRADGADTLGAGVEARAAVIFDYDSHWMGQIQPQGADWNVQAEAFRAYSALRSLGIDVDIVGPSTQLSRYSLIVLPAVMHVSDALAAALVSSRAHLVIGPRTGSKTRWLSISEPLPPGGLAALTGVHTARAESLPRGVFEDVGFGSDVLRLHRWRERLECHHATTVVEARYLDGSPALVRTDRTRYISGCLDATGWRTVLSRAAKEAGLDPHALPDGLRISRLGALVIACNYADEAVTWTPGVDSASLLVGGATLAAHDVAVWLTSTEPSRALAPQAAMTAMTAKEIAPMR